MHLFPRRTFFARKHETESRPAAEAGGGKKRPRRIGRPRRRPYDQRRNSTRQAGVLESYQSPSALEMSTFHPLISLKTLIYKSYIIRTGSIVAWEAFNDLGTAHLCAHSIGRLRLHHRRRRSLRVGLYLGSFGGGLQDGRYRYRRGYGYRRFG